MEWFIPLLLTVLLTGSLYAVYQRKVSGKPVKHALLLQIAAFFSLLGLGMILGFGARPVYAASQTAASAGLTVGDGMGLLAAALATAVSGIGSGIGVAAAASAAIGAISENEKVFAKALIFVAMAESIALFGFVISFQILTKIG